MNRTRQHLAGEPAKKKMAAWECAHGMRLG
jgi:hypothetical protein